MEEEIHRLLLRDKPEKAFAKEIELIIKNYVGRINILEIEKLLIRNKEWLFRNDIKLQGVLDTARAIEFARKTTINPILKNELIKTIRIADLGLNSLGTTLASRYKSAYNTILNEGYSRSQIAEIIETNTVRGVTAVPYVIKTGFESIDSFNNRVRTLSDTLYLGISRLEGLNENLESGIKRFKFTGNPVPEREFCVLHFGNIYSIDEILLMNNGQGIPVMTYCGGYNCRHF
jgi:hypothetical protein